MITITLFIKRRLDSGDRKGEIAKRIGKPSSFVTEHLSFFEMADCVRDLYDSELVTSMQALYMLHRAYEKHPDKVEELCAKGEPLSTAEIRKFVEALNNPERSVVIEDAPEIVFNQPDSNDDFTPGKSDEEQQPLVIDGEPISGGDLQDQYEQQGDKLIKDADASEKIKKPIIQVKHDDRPARFVVNKRSDYGYGWIKYDDDGHETEVLLSEISLVAVVEG